MKKWFKLWFIPIILIGILIGFWSINVKSKFSYIKPADESIVIDEVDPSEIPISDKIAYRIPEVKRKWSYFKENPINLNVFSGAIIGWIVCKILDLGVILIKRRIVK